MQAALLGLGFLAAVGVSVAAFVDAAHVEAAPSLAASVASVPIADERPGTSDLYFIGGAGWAKQDVFFREATAARTLFDQRFDTAGRSMLLSNDDAAGAGVPAFTNATLREAIHRVGAKMDTRSDVLFLYLTSHGSQQGLAVDGDVLEPTALRNMLDDAGITWRVIVIAGCETGVFLSALKNDTTLVATASSEDRPSYGCASGRAYTDFGAALLSEELPQATSFSAALREAAHDVTRNEDRNEWLHSEPQIAEGGAIAEKLRSGLRPSGTPRFAVKEP